MKTKRSLIALSLGLGLILTLGLFVSISRAAPGNPVLDPTRNSHTAPLTNTVSIAYDEPISAATVTSHTFAVHGMQSGLVTAIHAVRGSTIIVTPTQSFHPGELVYAIATTSTLNITGTGPLSATQWQFITAVAGGSGSFADSGQSLGDGSTAGEDVALGDLDGDGDLDAFVANDGAVDHVWLNDGMGDFHSGQSLYDSDWSRSVALGDVDGDGDLDAFVANCDPGSFNTVWLNDGTGTFGHGQSLGSSDSYAVALGDVDGDGDLDAFVGNFDHPGQPNTVWINDGTGTFSDSGQGLGNLDTLGVGLGDLDSDGDLDAFVANANNQPNKVWVNDGAGTFSDSGQNLGDSSSEAVALGDVDGDGDLDAFVPNYEEDEVWLNDGKGIFSNSLQFLSGLYGRDAALGDVDGDGDLDAFVVYYDNGPDEVWLNDGAGTFDNSGQVLDLSSTMAVALGDLDGDGDLDAFVGSEYGRVDKVWLNWSRSDLALSKTISPSVSIAGQSITYTIVYTNLGPEIATGILITDDVPISVTRGSLNYTSSGAAISPTGSISYAWGVEPLSPGEWGIITLTGVLSDPLATGTFTNTAIITAAVLDNDLVNNNSSAELMVMPPRCYATYNDGATVHKSLDAQALRDAVAGANSGDVVKVAGICVGVDGGGRVVYVNKNLTLRGGYTPDDWGNSDPDVNPTTLDAQNGGRVVYLDSGDVTLESVHITGGNVSGNGGGIYNYSATLTLSNTIVVSNSATADGGGVFVEYGNTTLNGGQIISNSADYGGGVFLYEDSATLDVNGGQIASNSSDDYGGGVFIVYGSMTLSGGDIISNTADYGGGVYIILGSATLSGGQIISNAATDGGGVYVEDGSATLNGGQIISNTAGEGGGVYVRYGNVMLDEGQILGNTASGGGGMFVWYGTVTLNGGQVFGNTASVGGGMLVYEDSATLDVNGGQIAGNTVTHVGGGVFVLYGSMTLNGGDIVSNTAENDGGGVYVENGDVILSEGQILGNNAWSRGGGVYVTFGSATFDVNGGQIVSNTAVHGGGVYVEDGSATLNNGQIVGNSAIDGGGVFINQGNAALDRMQVIHNSSRDGGGIYNDDGTLDLINTTLSHNTSSYGGGGALYNQSGTATLVYVTIVSNTAASQGDGLYRSGGTVTLQNSIVADNGAENCYGGMTSNGHNLDSGDTCGFGTVGDQQNADPRIGLLADNGGDTLTHALLPGSQAIDTGVCLAGVTTDQRGHPRPDPISPFCDIGAYESDLVAFPDLVIAKSVTPTAIIPGDLLTYTLTFSNTGVRGATGVVITDRVPSSVTIQSVISSGIAIADTGASPDYVWSVADLAPGADGVITITGYLSDTLPDDHTFSNTATIACTETESDDSNNSDSAGVIVQAPEITVSPLSVAFGDQDVDAGATVSQTVTITNDGSADLHFTSAITLTRTDADEFIVEDDTGDNPLMPGSTRTVQISFNPSSTGAKTANLTIRSDDNDEDTMNVVLSGTGIDQEITVTPLSLEFGGQDVDAGATVSQTVIITNAGSADLNFTNVITLTGTDAAEFIVEDDTGENPLTPGSARTVWVSFDPSSMGPKSASLTIQSDDSDEGIVSVALSGTGVAAPEITVSPLSLNFGDQDVDAGATVSQTVFITNDGTADLNFGSAITLTGTDATEFVIESDTGEDPLSPGGTRTVWISFDPSSMGAKSTNLTIHSDDSDEGTVNVALSGVGTASVNNAPVADAGSDQTVAVSTLVTLDGSGSYDPDGHTPLTYGWGQSGGPDVVLNNSATVSPTFDTPGTFAVLTFTLVVTDSKGLPSAPDTVVITVTESPVPALRVTKSVDTDGLIEVPLGGAVTYTIVISNDGDGVASDVVMADDLPNGVVFGGWVQQGSAMPPLPTVAITWGPHDVLAGAGYEISFRGLVTTSSAFAGKTITNTAAFGSTGAGFGFDEVAFAIADLRRIYLPLIVRN